MMMIMMMMMMMMLMLVSDITAGGPTFIFACNN